MKYWLMKSEPTEFSIDDFENIQNKVVEWFGIRNYQARNFMRDEMQVGDKVLFWHSSCKNPGIYGIVEVSSKTHPDSTQFNMYSDYYDPKSNEDKPRWWCVDVRFIKKIKYISIATLRGISELEEMQVLQRGNRLSITKVTHEEWKSIDKLINL